MSNFPAAGSIFGKKSARNQLEKCIFGHMRLPFPGSTPNFPQREAHLEKMSGQQPRQARGGAAVGCAHGH